ncbi:hypothetical protein ERO13_D11G248450v2 [Gossypium hirsutum]|uniref:Uncharacterized protein n=1 Tax=Gossypium barbadense TaxID=3634 RepID=A0A5J5PIX8_GOSBA|nr:hypothetical protein ES319_D11G268900v1 [Gossypium barbadense]KAG4122142.1 hypothetical protein ERO13_D11G248450v2 [Gossypium hirsutum]
MRFRFSLSLNSLFIYLFICITNFEPTVLSIYPYICVLQILYVNMAKMTLHFVIVIIELLFNHTCTFTGSEKVSPVPKDKSMISNFDLFSRQIQLHFLSILLIISNLRLKFFASFSTYTKPLLFPRKNYKQNMQMFIL